MAIKKGSLKWRKTHLENLIWSANQKGGLFRKKDIPRFKKKLAEIKRKELIKAVMKRRKRRR